MSLFYQSRGTASAKIFGPKDLDPARMGIFAAKNLEVGDTVSIENVSFKWPNKGLSVDLWEIINGRSINRRVTSGEPIDFSSLD